LSEIRISRYCENDIPALSTLWQDVFGDSAELIARFFELLPQMGTALAAHDGKKLVGMVYLIDGFELLPQAKRLGYIYALAVDESARGLGLGSKLTLAAKELAYSRGCDAVCTLPAEASLYPWYDKLLSTASQLHRKKKMLSPEGGIPTTEISPDEYLARREALLTDAPHVALSLPCLKFQHELCREYGGGFFAVGDAIAAAYLEGGCGRICELLSPADEVEKSARALCAALGADYALMWEAAEEGEAYIIADKQILPFSCHWGLSFD